MTLDAVAAESHFIDHLAPVWSLLPDRGTFYAAEHLVPRAQAKGIDAVGIDIRTLRSTPQRRASRHGKPALIASIGDAKLGRRLGYGPFAFLEHGAGQSYESRSALAASYAGGPDRDDHELVMVPNEYAASKWRKTYPNTRILTVGCPKIDALPVRQIDPIQPGPVVAISFHWPVSPFVSPYAGTAFEEYRAALPELAQRFQVIGHEHPNWLGRKIGGAPSRTYQRLGIPFVEEFEDVCRQADVYVTDNSSTLFEFAATGRPVVVLNSRNWTKGKGPGLRFWDAADVGIQVDRPADLADAVAEALEDAPARQIAREAALNLVYQPRTNGAAYAVTAITDWLASRQAVAA